MYTTSALLTPEVIYIEKLRVRNERPIYTRQTNALILKIPRGISAISMPRENFVAHLLWPSKRMSLGVPTRISDPIVEVGV